jgi:DNA-binding NtrC family response regulator
MLRAVRWRRTSLNILRKVGTMARTVLIVEDDPAQRRYLETVVQGLDFRVLSAGGGREAIDVLTGRKPEKVDLVVLDLVMPEIDGFAVLDAIRPKHPTLPVIVLTMKGGVDTVVKVIRTGAVDFIVKPVSPERLQVSIENALKLTALSGEVSRLTRKADGRASFSDIVLRSDVMRQTVELARRGAASTIPVLIEGESGVGKELFARAIQGSGDRAGKPFVAVNCGAIPENLVESILFGHEKGAFTGADHKQTGKFQEADGGTIFLDEVSELRSDLQVKLLRALQEGEIDPVGSQEPVRVDVRVISATNRDLAQRVAEGSFREDLFYRLSVFPIRIPSLRERREDIVPLAYHFVSVYTASEGKNVRTIAPEAVDVLVGHGWPGNVRQLENAIFRAVVLCDGDTLNVCDFPQIAQARGISQSDAFDRPSAGPAAAATSTTVIPAIDQNGELRTLQQVENDMIRLSLQRCRGQMSEVARRLDIGRSTLYRKIRDLGLDADEFKREH